MADIEKAGLLAVREGRVLLCRKRRGTRLWILPGGKYEPGEDGEACLRRELAEEIGGARARVGEFVASYTSVAAGEGDRTLRVDLFLGDIEGAPEPRAEIGELRWFGESDEWAELAPSLRETIFPDLIRRGVLRWAGRG